MRLQEGGWPGPERLPGLWTERQNRWYIHHPPASYQIWTSPSCSECPDYGGATEAGWIFVPRIWQSKEQQHCGYSRWVVASVFNINLLKKGVIQVHTNQNILSPCQLDFLDFLCCLVILLAPSTCWYWFTLIHSTSKCFKFLNAL